MIFNELDTVVLKTDPGKHGLRSGDVGTVVHVHSPDELEVEFVRASGRTQALLTVLAKDVRPTSDDDMITVRHVDPGEGIV
jgi:hypothetical protein